MIRTIGSIGATAVMLVCGFALLRSSAVPAKAAAGAHPAALVELFTSEGCSSCPPADALLREVAHRDPAHGPRVVVISEHVSYWDQLGWKDPYSSDLYTRRQDAYRARFGLDSAYTPQMVVNGRVQFVGSDRRALDRALADTGQQPAVDVHIQAAQLAGDRLSFSYNVAGGTMPSGLQWNAVIVDDADRSEVLRGENSGRQLTHVSVARVFLTLGAVNRTTPATIAVTIPPATLGTLSPHRHLVLFAQDGVAGPVAGVDTAAL